VCYNMVNNNELQRRETVMKRSILLFTVFLFMFIPVYGDDAVLGGKGNTVYPIFDTSVKMLGENVYIEVKDGKSFVRC